MTTADVLYEELKLLNDFYPHLLVLVEFLGLRTQCWKDIQFKMHGNWSLVPFQTMSMLLF